MTPLDLIGWAIGVGFMAVALLIAAFVLVILIALAWCGFEMARDAFFKD